MKKIAYLGSAFALPLLAFAQGPINASNVVTLSQGIIQFINGVAVPLIFALAFIVFIWGIFQYFIMGGSDEEKRKEGKNLMIYGIAGFAIMASVWGLVNILTNSFQLDNRQIQYPDAPKTNT